MKVEKEKGKDTWKCSGYYRKDGKWYRYFLGGFLTKRDALESGLETQRTGEITRVSVTLP